MRIYAKRSRIQRETTNDQVATKLEIGQPDDQYEQEADATADKVMRMPSGVTEEDNINPMMSGAAVQKQSEDEPALQMQTESDQDIQMQSESDDSIQMMPDEDQVSMQSDEEMISKSGDASAPAQAAGGKQFASKGLANQINSTKGFGQSLKPETQGELGAKMGGDFSRVKVHTDGRAVAMNKQLGAKAFTHGSDIYFNQGNYDPGSSKGKHLLAHELTHVIQQSGRISKKIQQARLRDFTSTKDPKNDPGRLSNSQIEATNEYKSLMNPNNIWQWQDKVQADEAQLICRLILRHIREGKAYSWQNDTRGYLVKAREQMGTVARAEADVGSHEWVPFNSGDAVADPTTLDSEFGKWLLAGGSKPSGKVSKLNCWEMIMFSSHTAGFISESRMKAIYKLGVANVKGGKAMSVGDTVESELRASNEYVFDYKNPNSPKPLRGDMIIFNRAAVHAAISTGKVNAAGEHEIISLWNYDGKRPANEKTTIETLVKKGASTPVRFWSINW